MVDKSEGELQNYYLISDNKKDHYLCPHEVFSMKPEGGMLGDIQIGLDGQVHFMMNEIICTADWNDRALCRYPNAFFKTLKNICQRPNDLGLKMDIHTDSNYISWLMSGSARMTIRCDREIPLKNKKV